MGTLQKNMQNCGVFWLFVFYEALALHRIPPLLLKELSLDWVRGELMGLSLKLGDWGSFSVGVSGKEPLSVIQGVMLCCRFSTSEGDTP